MTEIEYRQLKQDIATARKIITNATAQYRKRKLGLKQKSELKDLAAAYADLEGYSSPEDIQDAYGYDMITDAERSRLIDLWDGRELARAANKKYEDRVTEMLERAWCGIDTPYIEDMEEYKHNELF